MKIATLLIGALLVLSGCASKSIYYWGNYEDTLYDAYASPEKADADLQIIRLEEDVQKAAAKGKPLPPGFHAHLGTLYYQTGDTEYAKRAFETEKDLFPESAVLMDRLIHNL